MNSKNLNWIFVVILLITAVNFFSCNKDSNPITPTPPPQLIIDSNIFDWKIDTIGGTLGGLDFYVTDTNKIFIPGTLFGIFINNGIINRINYLSNDQFFQARCINGTSENNVYFGGCISKPNDKAYPRLKKWNGNSIINIPLPDDTCTILKIEVISDNDIWMSTNKNIIYHYNNSVITTYRLENGLSDGFIQKDNNGILYSHYIKYYGLMYDASFYLFKFENNNWIQVNRDTIYLNSEFGYYGGIVNNLFTRKGLTGFYYFSGNNWVKFINTGNSLIGLLCAGNNFSNVLFHGIEEGIGNLLFYYNGNQIYRQRNYHFTGEMIYHIQYKFGRFYFSSEDFNNFETYLGIGTIKKQNLKPLNPKKNEKNYFFNNHNNSNN